MLFRSVHLQAVMGLGGDRERVEREKVRQGEGEEHTHAHNNLIILQHL